MRIALLASALCAASLAPVASPAGGSLTAGPASVPRGGSVTFTGTGCGPSARVFLISSLFPGHAYGVGAIATTARANGSFRSAYRIPRTRKRGTYVVTVRCGGGNLGVAVTIHVR